MAFATPCGVKVSALGYPQVFAPEGPSLVTPLPYPDIVLFKGQPQSGELEKHPPVTITPAEAGFCGNVSHFRGELVASLRSRKNRSQNPMGE